MSGKIEPALTPEAEPESEFEKALTDYGRASFLFGNELARTYDGAKVDAARAEVLRLYRAVARAEKMEPE